MNKKTYFKLMFCIVKNINENTMKFECSLKNVYKNLEIADKRHEIFNIKYNNGNKEKHIENSVCEEIIKDCLEHDLIEIIYIKRNKKVYKITKDGKVWLNNFVGRTLEQLSGWKFPKG
jgi:hypothetical protein